MVTRIDLQNVSLETFRDAARTGGRMRVTDSADGRKQLVYGERRTLFGRAVGWIRDAFKSDARVDRETGEEVAAARVFFELIETRFRNAARTAVTAFATDDLKSDIPLTKLVERSIEIAKVARRGERNQTIARNMAKTEAVRPGTQGFAQASAAAGVDAGSLSIGQLKFADAVIRFEALATRDTPLEESDIVAIAQAAARTAGALTTDLTDTVWFSGKVTFAEEIDRLMKEDPVAVGALLGSTPRMDAALLKMPAFNALMKEAVGEARLQFYLPDEAFPLPDGDAKLDRDFFSTWTAEKTFETNSEDVTGFFRSRLRQKPPVSVTVPWGNGTVDYRVAGQFLADAMRTDMLIPVEADVTAEAAEAFDAEELIRDLAAKAPAVERTIDALSDEDTNRLDDFAEAVRGLADGEETRVVLQPAPPKMVGQDVKDPDGELTLTARRGDDGIVQISAAMEANLANLDSAEDATRQVVLLAGGDREKVRQYTSVLNQTGLNMLQQHVQAGLKIGNEDHQILVIAGYDNRRESIRASFDESGDLTLNISSSGRPSGLFATRQPEGSAPDMLHLDATRSFETKQTVIRLLPGDDGASDAGDGNEVTMELVEPMRQEVNLRPDFKTLARRELDSRQPAVRPGGDPDDAKPRDGSANNDLLFSLYAPGGLKEAEIWGAANADPDDFSEAAKDLVGLLLANEVHLASGPLTPDAFVRKGGSLIRKVAGLTERQVVESLRADANLARVLDRTLEELLDVRSPDDLVDSLRTANLARTRLLEARGIGFDKEAAIQALAPVNTWVIAGWPTQKVRQLVDRMLESPDVRAFMAVYRDTLVNSASSGLLDEQKQALFAWGDVFEGVLRAALERLGRDAELFRVWEDAADRASPDRSSAMYEALADASAADQTDSDEGVSDTETEEEDDDVGVAARSRQPARGVGVFSADEDEGQEEAVAADAFSRRTAERRVEGT